MKIYNIRVKFWYLSIIYVQISKEMKNQRGDP